jgi:NADH pyrophosphatase NudC (nudix superfamily)
VEPGETLEECVKREIKEESGIDVEVLKLICVNSNTRIRKWHDGVTDVPTTINFHFICNPIGGEIHTSEETSDVQWIVKDKVLEMITTPFCRYTYQIFLDANEKVIYTEYEISPEFKVKARYEL